MQNINKINDYNSFILCIFNNCMEFDSRRLQYFGETKTRNMVMLIIYAQYLYPLKMVIHIS